MTLEEAIKELKPYADSTWGGLREALNMAIKAMEKLEKVEKWLEEKAND
jgi:hypothetical protein